MIGLRKFAYLFGLMHFVKTSKIHENSGLFETILSYLTIKSH